MQGLVANCKCVINSLKILPIRVYTILAIAIIVIIIVFVKTISINTKRGTHGIKKPSLNSYIHTTVYIAVILFSWLTFLMCLYHMKWLIALNDFITKIFRSVFAISSNQAIIRSKDFSITAYITTFFSLGIAVLSLASQRRSADLNPYVLQEYFHIPLFLVIMLHLTLSAVYLQVVNLRALSILVLLFQCVISISQSAYCYLFHTPNRVAYNMAKILSKEIHTAAYLKKHSAFEGENLDVVFDNLIRWNKTLLNSKADLLKQAEYNLQAVQYVMDNRKNWTKKKKTNSLLAFSLGYFSLYPGIDYDYSENQLHRAYYRALLANAKHMSDIFEKNEKWNIYMAGLLFARVQVLIDFNELNNPMAGRTPVKNQSEEIPELNQWKIDAKSILGIVWDNNMRRWCGRYFWAAVYAHTCSVFELPEIKKYVKKIASPTFPYKTVIDDEYIEFMLYATNYKQLLSLNAIKASGQVVAQYKGYISTIDNDDSSTGGTNYDLP